MVPWGGDDCGDFERKKKRRAPFILHAVMSRLSATAYFELLTRLRNVS